MPKRRTHEEFVSLLKEINPDISVNSTTKIKVINNICKHSWITQPASLLNGTNCPICNGSAKKKQEEFENELHMVNPNIRIIGEYKGLNKKISCMCLKDNHEWEALPSNLLRNHGCPFCNGRAVIKGINDLHTTHPHILKYIYNTEDSYKYSAGSHAYIDFICPDCGNVRKAQIKSIISQGFSCAICRDGISYPNKFSYELLNQLPVDNVVHEYSPDWLKPYRFDNYFEYNEKCYVLEMDGDFHFKNNGLNGQSLEKSQQIDLLKDKLARKNGIDVIRIDCRKSEFLYIKNQITNSRLNTLFDLNKIDWVMCDKFASSNFKKEVCKFYQDNKTIMNNEEISNYFSISLSTLCSYLKTGRNVGWIKDDVDKTILNSLHRNYSKSKRIGVFDITTNNLLYEFKSINLCKNSLQRIDNVLYNGASIAYAIKNKGGLYKNYLFKYI